MKYKATVKEDGGFGDMETQAPGDGTNRHP